MLSLTGITRLSSRTLIIGDTIWSADPGVAPYGITLAAGKLYVTNWAGRHPAADDKDVAGVPWGLARVDNNKCRRCNKGRKCDSN